jgi:hypothetical protein
VIGMRGRSVHCQVAVLLPQGSFLHSISRTMWEYFKRGSVFPDLQNTIIMYLTTYPVLPYYNYRILDYTCIRMCTALPKVFVNRIESDRLMEKIPQRRFLLLLCFFVLLCHSVSNPGLWKWICM